MQQASAFLGLSIVSFVILGAIACSKNRSDFREEPASFGSGDSGAPECQEGMRCSRDLKKVLFHHCDGKEEVVAECGPDLGCGDGACVDACKSAELSKGSIGCSFATLPPDETVEHANGSCLVAMIANTWDHPVTIHATLGTEPIDIGSSTYYAEMDGPQINYTRVDGPLPSGKVALVFLAERSDGSPFETLDNSFTPCPVTVVPALRRDPIAHKTTRTHAFVLTTDAPVSAYSIWPYGGASTAFPTATLLLPISSWGTHYVAVSAAFLKPWNDQAPGIQIVAADDNTEVRMRPNVDIRDGNGVLGIAQGRTQTWTLSRGEVLQITQEDDTSGSPIVASKPVGLFGSSQCTYIPAHVEWCDTRQQQIPPVSQWGSEYALVPYRPRLRIGLGDGTNIDGDVREVVPWRFVGAANGTKLTYDPARPSGAPETLEAGQVVTFTTNEVVIARSQGREHPFYAAVFMTGAATTTSLLGDPDFVNVVPSEQFLDRYVFFADYTYTDTTLTVVRHKSTTGFHPVILECAGEITGWKPLGSTGEYQFAWVYVTKNRIPQKFPGGTCGYGRHEMYSDNPFSVTVWGTAIAASYGYPGGQGSRPLSDVTGPPVN